MSRRRPVRFSEMLPSRPAEGRLLAGVCIGVANRLEADVTLVRLAFLIAGLAWGIGLLLYGLLWALAPDESDRGGHRGGEGVRGEARGLWDDLSRSGLRFSQAWKQRETHSWPLPLSRRWIAVGMVAFGVLILLTSFGVFSWLNPTRALGLTVITAGAALMISLGRT